ncbi:MAG TPA: glycosyltransferase family 4 protein [Candidatus Krumholzibacteria bacterium]|nr:glycosyltransferase family 4 protein [Candidatus Krumholzibacteria bacterium]
MPPSPRTTPLRLAIVNGMPGFDGAEVWMLDSAAALTARGHEVLLVVRPGGELERRARSAGLPTAPIPIRWDTAPWTLARLWRRIRAHRPHAVLCHRLKDLKAAGPAARLAGVPVVLHTRESDVALRPGRPYYRWYLNRVATGVLVNSEATGRTLRASAPWLPADRIHLLHKGIDLVRFRPSPPPPGAPTVGFAGQWTERKGLHALMAAWERLRSAPEAPPRARLQLAGAGDLEPDLRAWRDRLPRPDEVELLGRVEDMPAFYAGIHVLAMPSRSEGFGLAAAEALACARPVVGGNASSLPEVIRHGETGLLVPPDDPAALAAALADLLTHPDRAAALGRAGRADVAARFDRESALDRLETLLSPAPPAPRKGTP